MNKQKAEIKETIEKYWSEVHFAAKGLSNKEKQLKKKIWEKLGKPKNLDEFRVPY